GIGPSFMQYLALVFAVAGTVFCVVVIQLSRLRRKARTAFTYLVFPCSLLYPCVMLTAFGAAGKAPVASISLARIVVLGLLLLASFAALFYNSKTAMNEMKEVNP